METRKATRSGPHAQNGLVIWRARKRKGLTQVELAEAAEIGRIQMIKLENGMHLPSERTRDLLEQALDLKAGTIKCEEAARPGQPFRGRDATRRAADERSTERRESGGRGIGEGDLAA